METKTVDAQTEEQLTALILSNDGGLSHEVSELLKKRSLEIIFYEGQKSFEAKLSKQKPTLVFIVYEDLQAGVEEYSRLHAETEIINDIPLYTVALCSAKQATLAVSLYQKHLINNYLIIRPLYDANRLDFIVHEARTSFNSAQGGVASAHLYNELLRAKKQLDAFINQSMSKGNTVHEQTLEAYRGFFARLDEGLKQLNATTPAPETPTAQLPEIENSRRAENQQWHNEFQKNYAALSENLVTTAETGKGQIRVLVLDDDTLYSSLVKQILSDCGYEPLIYDNAKLALPAMIKFSPDIVLLDYEMPDHSGAAVLDYMAKHKQLAGIPVIMLSGHREKDTVTECLRAGAQDYIVKPGSKALFAEKISLALRGR